MTNKYLRINALITILAFSTIVIILFSSCSSWTAFTPTLAEKLGDKIYDVQLSTSASYKISRSVEDQTNIKVKSGKIFIEGGKTTQEIFFPAGTLCVVDTINGALLGVRLEKAENNPMSTFGPNPTLLNRFTLMAKNGTTPDANQQTVTYGGETFLAEFDQIPYMMVQKKAVKKIENQSHVATGIKVGKTHTVKKKKIKEEEEDF